jgi:hypothetical protein
MEASFLESPDRPKRTRIMAQIFNEVLDILW